MARPTERTRIVASVVVGVGGVLLVASLTQPIARQGVGSALSLHELFDLLLADSLPLGIPRWLGLLGYLPALGGACLLMSEAFIGRTRQVLRVPGLAVALTSVAVLVVASPWNRLDLLGPGAWLGICGAVLASAGVIIGRGRRVCAPGGSDQVALPTTESVAAVPFGASKPNEVHHALSTLRP